MSYQPHPDFLQLFDAYTGPNSMAAELGAKRSQSAGDRSLLVSTGSDLVLFPGGGAAPIVESFRLSTRGFKELTAVSHLGTVAAWLAEMNESGDGDWRRWAEKVAAQCRAVRAVNADAYWRDVVRVAAWKGMETKIADVVDYACRATEALLADVLAHPERMTYAYLREHYLEPVETKTIAVPFNDVMVATFALTFLDIAHRTLSWVRAQDLDWSELMVMICGSSGRPTAGLTWATNSTCHILWRASGERFRPENMLIAPHAPGLTLDMINSGANLAEIEARYRAMWTRTRVTAEIGGKMFQGFPGFVPDINAAPIMTTDTKTLSEMPRLRYPDDRLTAIARLRLVMEDPRQLLSNSVSEFIIDELCHKDLNPAAVVIPGFTNVSYPARGRG
ncbi:DUF5624 domain-containing protein [Aminobacter sp. MET-1]|uniref:DUF5624 domain-containing protein n=1 Tax=Aminobacter sp. MET-1 TaxID=2951085 RepID=UPI00226A14D2|nr:DUF5624 domain-containing protein [Aminobacter sp. MET-1]MCX8570753.1 DUF5624 domain-containing protein [Aminobacter sp. MET-1]